MEPARARWKGRTMNLLTQAMDLSVGVRLLDCDHRRLADAIHELFAAVDQQHDRVRIAKALRQLADFALTHFGLEEGMMAATAYPKIAPHRAHHQQLVEQLETLCDSYGKGALQLDRKSLAFLSKWHSEHLQKDDLDYGLWLNNHGIR